MQNAALRRWKGQPRRLDRCAAFLSTAFLAGATSLSGQAPSPLVSAWPGRLSVCSSDELRERGRLTLRQRACWYGSELVSPETAARAAFSSGIGQWRNAPYMKGQEADDYMHRFAAYYTKLTARETGELFAGYLNHEDPRPQTSRETVFVKRLRSSLLSVLIVRDDAGDRPSFAPIAGSLASGFAGAACYREHTEAKYALQGAGLSYSGYFGRALYHEFQPDIRYFVRRMLHKTPG
jgi:hypothetical protein